MATTRLTVGEKLSYGIADFALNICYTTLGFYLLFFLVNVAGIKVEIAGIIFLVARAWDAVSDYLMGMISDRTISRYGKRKVYLLFGAIPLGIAFFLLWIVPFESSTALIVYYFCMTLVFNTAFTVVAVPYNAMMPELSQDYHERLNISGYRISLTFLGNLMAAAGVALIVDFIFPGKTAYRQSYPVMGVIFGILIAVCVYVTYFRVHPRIETIADRSSSFWKSIVSTFIEVLGLREFRIIMGMFLFNMIGLDVIMATMIFFLKDVILISEDMTFVMMGIPLVVAVLSAPLWVYIGKRLGKQMAYIIGAIYFVLILLLCLVIKPGNTPLMFVIMVLAGIGISVAQVVPWSIIPDVIEIDEYEHGGRREGAFYGISTFLYKTASAIAIALASFFLVAFGYVENSATPQPESAQFALRILMSIIPGIMLLASAWFVKVLPINRERFNEILSILEERRKTAPN